MYAVPVTAHAVEVERARVELLLVRDAVDGGEVVGVEERAKAALGAGVAHAARELARIVVDEGRSGRERERRVNHAQSTIGRDASSAARVADEERRAVRPRASVVGNREIDPERRALVRGGARRLERRRDERVRDRADERASPSALFTVNASDSPPSSLPRRALDDDEPLHERLGRHREARVRFPR